ncbi:MAG: hypothetical protein GX567_03515, partial [Clostridia bacterium]|nr:hypothetical protein [Clostridia bacterium]
IVADIKITWLLHIISFRIRYEDSLTQTLRIFGIKFKKPKPRIKNNKKEVVEDPVIPEQSAVNDMDAADLETDDTESSDLEINQSDQIIGEQCNEEQSDDTSQNERETFYQKVKRFIKWLIGLKDKILYTIKEFYGKIKLICKRLDYYIDFLQDESHVNAFKLCFGQLGKLINHIKPRKHHIWFHLGFDDPETLGTVLSILSIVNSYTNGAIKIQPDFEQTILEGRIFLKGRVQAIVLIRIAWIIYFDKNVKALLKDFKEEDS